MSGCSPAPLAGADCVGLVAGSGIDLLPLLDAVLDERPFAQRRHPPVAGHACRFVLGRIGNHDAIVQCGRHHLYEGWSLAEIAVTVDQLRDFGAQTMVLTNAVGALRDGMVPGDIVAAEIVRCWPFAKHPLPDTLTPDFVVAGADHAGPYRWMHGPCYETRAEVQALRTLGDATVGMSIAPELLRCKELALPTVVLSCVTNRCGTGERLTHDAVLAAAKTASSRLSSILRRALCPRRSA